MRNRIETFSVLSSSANVLLAYRASFLLKVNSFWLTFKGNVSNIKLSPFHIASQDNVAAWQAYYQQYYQQMQQMAQQQQLPAVNSAASAAAPSATASANAPAGATQAQAATAAPAAAGADGQADYSEQWAAYYRYRLSFVLFNPGLAEAR